MNTVIVTRTGADGLVVRLAQAEEGDTHEEVLDEGPSPIAPEVKEMAWGAGAFVVFAVLMRLVLYPRMKQGMDARYSKIRGDIERADDVRASAQAEVAEYQTAVSGIKAEAAIRVDAARQTVEAERTAAVAAANSRIGERRNAALAEAAAAMAAARGQIEAAVGEVAGRATELAIERSPSADSVARAVSSAMTVGAGT